MRDVVKRFSFFKRADLNAEEKVDKVQALLDHFDQLLVSIADECNEEK